MFHFRLQSVLELRENDRDERLAELAKALRAADILRERRQELERETGENEALARKLAEPGTANIDRILLAHRYEAVLRGLLAQLAGQETQVAAEIERRRLVLVEADRQVRVLEKLKVRKLEEHLQNVERLEMKQLDETAALAFHRRRHEQPEEAAV